MKAMERYTLQNPGTRPGEKATYRVWMDRAGENSFKTQGHELYMFGDLANRLGELEDFMDDVKKAGLYEEVVTRIRIKLRK